MIKTPIKQIHPTDTKFHGMYRGVVESNASDPMKAGRVKVRIFGIHSPKKTLSSDGTEGIPTDELPWAEPALGLFEGSVSGFGSWSVPLQGSHVFLFFENGNPMKPIYFASAPGITTEAPNADEGFNDPLGEYPKMERMGEPDFHRLSRGVSENTIVTKRNESVETDILKGDDSKWTEPDSAYNATYPNNTVLVSHSGLTVEMDSTPEEERFNIHHPSNTYIEIDHEGNLVIRNEKNKFEIVKGEKNTYIILDNNETIGGDKTKLVKQDEIMKVNENQHEVVGESVFKQVVGEEHKTIEGSSKVYMSKTSDVTSRQARNVYSGDTINMDAARTININSGIASYVTAKLPKNKK